MRRRQFIRGLGLTLAANCVPLLAPRQGAMAAMMGGGGGMMGGGGCGGGGSSVIDPPIGAAFKDPVEIGYLPNSTGAVEANLEAIQAKVNVNGTMANLLTYNGTYPGPTIKVKRGDKLKVHFKNSLPDTTELNMLGHQKNITALHTHGLHVDAEPPVEPPTEPPPDPDVHKIPVADYVMYKLYPGETQEHEYDLSLQPAGTLNFYHGHIHGLTAEQSWGGMAGAILVEDPTDSKGNPLVPAYETHLMVLKDITLSGNAPAPYTMMGEYMNGKEGNIIMVNGQVNPSLAMKPGQVQRWRILNASNARFYKLSLQGHMLNIIGTDGGLLDTPVPVSSILLSPGERLDVLVKASTKAGNYKFLSLPYSRMGMGGMGGGQTITLLTSVVSGKAISQSIPSTINPAAARITPDTSMLTRRSLTLSMGMGAAYINGQSFDVNPYEIMSSVGTYEIWDIRNMSNMDHPFHQHLMSAQVLSVSGGDATYNNLLTLKPALKDVVIVPKMGAVSLLIPIMDWTGHAMFHCHILEHEDIGMMGMWHIMGM